MIVGREWNIASQKLRLIKSLIVAIAGKIAAHISTCKIRAYNIVYSSSNAV
jgi:hypothetical protein